MIRAQCLVQRGRRLLMVRHRLGGEEWWCLPGGGVEAGESPADASLRELKEECCVDGKILSQLSGYTDAAGIESITFFIDIGDQQPCLGEDPEFTQHQQILADMRWMALEDLPERDRAYLFAAGLLSLPGFLMEVTRWGDAISYPAE